ncbi:MAG: ACP S-malonyltransferase [Alphaproteobacteria bacterium]
MDQAFLFPGQGSQAVGMGSELADAYPAARDVFAEVDDALGQSLSRLMFEGPEHDLNLTENTQPALMAASLAVVRVLEGEGLDLAKSCRFVAGHSLGEYSALAATGAFSLPDAIRLVRVRARAMQDAVPEGAGGIAALIGIDRDGARDIAAAAVADGNGQEVCVVAGDNAPDQILISGSRGGVDRAMDIARERGVKRVIELPLSVPTHCPLLAPAADTLARALADIPIKAPAVPLVSNVAATAVSDPDTIRDQLVAQLTSAVRWRESILYMKDQGIGRVVELGAGRVLTGLARRIDRSLTGVAVQGPDDVEAFLKAT